jgi:hypothetical protein
MELCIYLTEYILPVDTAASIAPTAANLVCQTPKMQAHLQKQHDP